MLVEWYFWTIHTDLGQVTAPNLNVDTQYPGDYHKTRSLKKSVNDITPADLIGYLPQEGTIDLSWISLYLSMICL